MSDAKKSVQLLLSFLPPLFPTLAAAGIARMQFSEIQKATQ